LSASAARKSDTSSRPRFPPSATTAYTPRSDRRTTAAGRTFECLLGNDDRQTTGYRVRSTRPSPPGLVNRSLVHSHWSSLSASRAAVSSHEAARKSKELDAPVSPKPSYAAPAPNMTFGTHGGFRVDSDCGVGHVRCSLTGDRFVASPPRLPIGRTYRLFPLRRSSFPSSGQPRTYSGMSY
jgi:hypothetical protein